MRVNHRFLYWGIFLVAIGGVLVVADLRLIDTAALTDALRLWPLAVVATGLGMVLRRTELRVPGLMLSAALPGLVLGAGLAAGPRVAWDCGVRDQAASAATTQGIFDGPATVSVRSACGSVNVTTAPGDGWLLNASSTTGRTPNVESSARSLTIDTTSHDDVTFFGAGRDTWDLSLPTSELDRLSLVVTAGHGQISLPGARIGSLTLTANAAEMVVVASAASVSDQSAVVNAGALRLKLPATSDLSGSLRVGAGDLRICAPAELGLRITSTGVGESVTVNGLQQHGSEWQSPDYSTAPHHAELTVSATFGAVEIDPIGGCA
jgi:hypothetical protein